MTAVVPKNPDILSSAYLFRIANELAKIIEKNAQGIGVRGVTRNFLSDLTIPLPPLEVQKEIVAEIEVYQKIIDGARQVVEHYQPRIPTRPDWPMANLASVTFFQEGPGIMAKDFRESGVPLVRLAGLRGDQVTLTGCNFVDPTLAETKWAHFRLSRGDILVLTSASFGRPAVVGAEAEGAIPYTGIIRFRPSSDDLDAGYLKIFLGSPAFMQQAEALASGAVIKHFGPSHLRQMSITLPPIAEQRAIVARIEEEQRLVNANKELIRLFEDKIKATINRVWGETE